MRRALVVALAVLAACGSTPEKPTEQSGPATSTVVTTTALSGQLQISDYIKLLRFAHEAKVRPGGTLHVVGSCRWYHPLGKAIVGFGTVGVSVATPTTSPDADGNFAVQIPIPQDLPPGSYTVGAACVDPGYHSAFAVDQGYGLEVEVALDAPTEPLPVLDFVAQQAGGSVRVAVGGRLDSMSAPVGGTIRGAGRCLRHKGPYLDTYAVQIGGWKPADFFGLPLITEGPTGPNGEFSFEAPLPAEIPAGSYGIAVSCGRCSGFAGCGVGFAFTIGDPPPDPTTTTGSTTTTTTKITTTAAASAAGFTG